VLTFTEKLEPAFSTVRVENATGARVDQGKAQVDPDSRTVLRIGLKPLPPDLPGHLESVVGRHAHHRRKLRFKVGQ